MKDRIYLLFLLVISIIFIIIFYKKGLWWGDDFALYISQAKAICDNTIEETRKLNQYSIDHSSMKFFSPQLAPWGLPILLAPVYFFKGIDIEAFKIITFASFLIFIASFFVFVKRKTSSFFAFLISLVIVTNQHYVLQNFTVQTELPFLACCFCSLIIIENFISSKKVLTGLLAGFLFWFSFSLRTEGVFLVFVYFFYIIYKIIYRRDDKRRFKFLALPLITFTILYFLSSFILPNSSFSHTGHFNAFTIQKAVNKVSILIDSFSELIFGKQLQIFGFVLFTFFMISGIIYSLSRHFIFTVTSLLYFALYTVWPFYEFRYSLLIFPYFLILFVIGIFTFIKKSTQQALLITNVILLILITINLTNIVSSLKDHPKQFSQGPSTQEFKSLINYLNMNTEKEDVLLFFRPRLITLYTGRKSAMIFDNWQNLINTGNYYIINKSPKTICQFKLTDPFYYHKEFNDTFENKFENMSFIVFKINKPCSVQIP